MSLFLGFDPGGTSRKWAYVCATTDLTRELYIGWLRDPNAEIAFDGRCFPFLSEQAKASIKKCLDRLLLDLLQVVGVKTEGAQDLVSVAAKTFKGIVVAVDAPSGFAIPGHGIRETEAAAHGNYNTPDQDTFLLCAEKWIREDNQTPLQQRVYWKLVGFCIYSYFLKCDFAADIALAATANLTPALTLELPTSLGHRIHVIESFPSQTYADTSPEAFSAVSRLAGKPLCQIPGSARLSNATFNRFRSVLESLSASDRENWGRIGGRLGDALDAFATLALGELALTRGLRAIGNDVNRLRREGAIMLPIV